MPSYTVLAVRANTTLDQLVDFAFASPPSVVTGQEYFLLLDVEGEGITWQRSAVDMIEDGAAYNTSSGTLTRMQPATNTTVDMAFEVWTTTPTLSNGPSYNVPAYFINSTRVACSVPANNEEAIDVQDAMFKVQ